MLAGLLVMHILPPQPFVWCCLCGAASDKTFAQALVPHLDAQHGGIDDEIAALIKDCIGVGGLGVCNQVLLPRHAPPKVDGLQVIQLRLSSLQLIGGCQGFVVGAPQLAALEAEDSYPPVPQPQHTLCTQGQYHTATGCQGQCVLTVLLLLKRSRHLDPII